MKPLEVLIVEDNPGDVSLISEMLEDTGQNIHVTIAEDGQEALDFLMNEHPSDPAPDLIILDLNLPKVDGFDVLAYMKAMPALRSIPVVVMTGSLKKEDEVKARSMGAAAYCIKPATVEEMDRIEKCLRGHLEPLSRGKGKNNSSGPSANANSIPSTLDVGYQPIPPPCIERYIPYSLKRSGSRRTGSSTRPDAPAALSRHL